MSNMRNKQQGKCKLIEVERVTDILTVCLNEQQVHGAERCVVENLEAIDRRVLMRNDNM
jgi:hypothetical protein